MATGRPRRLRWLVTVALLVAAPAIARPFNSSVSVAGQAQATVKLRPGDVRWQSLAPGGHDSYALALRAGETVVVIVRQRGVDVVLSVIDPNGREQHRVDRPNVEWGWEAITIVTEISGTYRIDVTTLQSVGPKGRYRLSVGPVRRTESATRRRVDAERAVTEAEADRATATLESTHRAVRQFERAVSLWHDARENYEEAVAMYGLALAKRFLGEHEQSLSTLRHAHRLMHRIGDGEGVVMTETGLAWTYLYLDDHRTAARFFRRALSRRHAADYRGAAANTFGLGWTQLVDRHPEDALSTFRDSLRLRRLAADRRGEALSLIGVAAALDRLNRADEAITSVSEALAIQRASPDEHGRAEALTVKGWALLHNGQPADALTAFDDAAAVHRALDDRAGEAAAVHGQAAALRSNGDARRALELAERGIALAESVRSRRSDRDLRTTYFASVQDLYELCLELLLQHYDATGDADSARRAFRISERGRARSLLDSMHGAAARRGRDAGRRTGAIEPSGADGNGREPLPVDAVQRSLDADTTMLVYATASSRSVLWLLGQEEFRIYELPPAAVIERGVRNLLAALSPAATRRSGAAASDSSAARGEAAALAALVLPRDAVGRLLKRIVIVPAGPLQSIPFDILPVGAARDGSGVTMLDDHEVVTLPSASILGQLRRAAWWDQPRKTVAVFADPVLQAGDERVRRTRLEPRPSAALQLPRLLGTRWEAQQIRRLVPLDRQFVALDFAAARSTVERLDLSKYRILHFGTHAVVDLDRPERSGLVLSAFDAQGRSTDGLIRASDIFKWPLDADLVVLSGCRTGFGRDVRGEGLMALSRGFLAAGASRLVISLWSVDDTATAELMAHLYQEMLGPEHRPPAAALRAAQLHMRASRRWRSPYFWSGFVLQGEWR